jgi:hypothetical protein
MLVIFLFGCSAGSNNLRAVSPEEYFSIDKCWKNESGHFSTIMIVTNQETSHIPYFISRTCDVIDSAYPKGTAFLNYLNAVSVSGDNGELAKLGYLTKPLSSNFVTHLPLPEAGDKVYVFEGTLKTKVNDGFVYYEITSVDVFKDTGLTFQEIIPLTPRQRKNLGVN